MMTTRGKFITLHGPNNLGKTTQAEAITARLNNMGVYTTYVKFPVYDLEPTGPRINNIIRYRTEILEPLELQKIYAQNRVDYQPKLRELLQNGWVIGEDYKGTGIAWGVTFGVDLPTMERVNRGVLEPDLSICLDGERFSSGIEREHLMEGSGLWDVNRRVHQELTIRYGWEVVAANPPKEKVTEDIIQILTLKFL